MTLRRRAPVCAWGFRHDPIIEREVVMGVVGASAFIPLPSRRAWSREIINRTISSGAPFEDVACKFSGVAVVVSEEGSTRRGLGATGDEG